MSEGPLFKQCPSCQRFSPEESNICTGCGYVFGEAKKETGETDGLQGRSQLPSGVPGEQAPRKKRGCLKKLGIGILAILGLIVVVGVIGSFLSDDFNAPATSAQPTARPLLPFTSTPADSIVSEKASESDLQTSAQPTESSIPPSGATPTVEEALQEFVLCDRLKANMLMYWGQVPDAIGSSDPRIAGDIEPGDYVRFLMSQPDSSGSIWIEVYPHDQRAVGNADNKVWIDWSGLVQFRLDQVMFTCEGSKPLTARETATATPEQPSAPSVSRPMVEVNSLINVREGPGTSYGIIGTAEAGNRFLISGKNAAGDWWQIVDSGNRTGWVYGPLVTPFNAANVRVVAPTSIQGERPKSRIAVKPGIHRLGIEIQAGIYVGQAGTDLWGSCYWARLSNLAGSDDILANDNAKGLYYVEVLSTDRAFETECELQPIESVAARREYLSVVPTGTYLVGRDIGPGLYSGRAGRDLLESCYWARLSNVAGTDDILANDNARGTYFVEVLPSDFALQTECQIEREE